MKYYLVYVPYKRILWQGSEKFIQELKESTGYTHDVYQIMTDQGVRELEWDF